jgi:hypothetical protein
MVAPGCLYVASHLRMCSSKHSAKPAQPTCTDSAKSTPLMLPSWWKSLTVLLREGLARAFRLTTSRSPSCDHCSTHLPSSRSMLSPRGAPCLRRHPRSKPCDSWHGDDVKQTNASAAGPSWTCTKCTCNSGAAQDCNAQLVAHQQQLDASATPACLVQHHSPGAHTSWMMPC